jgi:hypothetical protein
VVGPRFVAGEVTGRHPVRAVGDDRALDAGASAGRSPTAGARQVSQDVPSTSTALAAPDQLPGPSPGAGTTTVTSS